MIPCAPGWQLTFHAALRPLTCWLSAKRCTRPNGGRDRHYCLSCEVSLENLLFREHAEQLPRERGGSSLLPRAVRNSFSRECAPCHPGPAGDATPRFDLIQSRDREIEHNWLRIFCVSAQIFWERPRWALHCWRAPISFLLVSIFPLSQARRQLLPTFVRSWLRISSRVWA